VRTAQTRSRENSYRLAMAAIAEALRARQNAIEHHSMNGDRKSQIGCGMRGDKRRTYRFQDDSVVDHTNNKSSRCSDVMRGQFRRLWNVVPK
jgi:peptide chain release factor 1